MSPTNSGGQSPAQPSPSVNPQLPPSSTRWRLNSTQLWLQLSPTKELTAKKTTVPAVLGSPPKLHAGAVIELDDLKAKAVISMPAGRHLDDKRAKGYPTLRMSKTTTYGRGAAP